MGSDFGKMLPVVTMIAGAVVAPYLAPASMSTLGAIALGAGVGGMAGQMAQPLTGYDPTGGLRDSAEAQSRANTAAIEQWRKQQEELFNYQKGELENLAPLQDEFTSQYGDILTGKVDVASSPMFSSMFANLRQSQARDIARINESFPEGGAKERAIRQTQQSYADQAGQMSGQIQKYIFDLAGQIQLPYGQVAGGSVPMGSNDYSALMAMQSQGMDPMAPLNLLSAYRTAGGGATTTKGLENAGPAASTSAANAGYSF